jgi:hypothetical protein
VIIILFVVILSANILFEEEYVRELFVFGYINISIFILDVILCVCVCVCIFRPVLFCNHFLVDSRVEVVVKMCACSFQMHLI